MTVLINELANLPHRDGQTVLHVIGDDREVEIKFRQGRYVVYLFLLSPRDGWYTRLAAEEPTAKTARDLAAEAWRGGPDFRTRAG